jgi:hypothetical protein
VLTNDEFVNEAINIVEKAKGSNLVLRILGALAIYLHSNVAKQIYIKIGRLGASESIFTDIDLVAYSKQRKQIMIFFEKTLGLEPDRMINMLFGEKRLIYHHPKYDYNIDLFFDKLEFSHDVNFGKGPGKGRLELDYPTISIADLILEKVQIHQISLKDVVDLVCLFLSHDVDRSFRNNEVIDGGYIAKVLADDWEFWYDATNNLNIVKRYANDFQSRGKISLDQRDTIIRRVDELLKMIEDEPKTKRWLKRAEKGTKKKWWRDVSDML